MEKKMTTGFYSFSCWCSSYVIWALTNFITALLHTSNFRESNPPPRKVWFILTTEEISRLCGEIMVDSNAAMPSPYYYVSFTQKTELASVSNYSRNRLTITSLLVSLHLLILLPPRRLKYVPPSSTAHPCEVLFRSLHSIG